MRLYSTRNTGGSAAVPQADQSQINSEDKTEAETKLETQEGKAKNSGYTDEEIQKTVALHEPKKARQAIPMSKRNFQFKCTGCGRCCTGAPGNIFVTKDDISRIAKKLNMSEKRFLQNHIRLSYDNDTKSERFSLKEMPSYRRPGDVNCEFLDDATMRCRIYDVRPLQCRTYPFWSSIVASDNAWEAEKAACEGIDHPDAEAVPREEIEAMLQKQKDELEGLDLSW